MHNKDSSMISLIRKNPMKRRMTKQKAAYTTLMAIKLRRRRKKRKATKVMTLKMGMHTLEKTMLKKTQQLQRRSYRAWQNTQNLMCNFNLKKHTKPGKNRTQPMLIWLDCVL